MKISLVIMAAGLGSRYGGDKQVDGVGPHGEILLEYGVYDAIRAGFERIVFIIKPGMEPLVDRLCGSYLRGKKTRSGAPLEVVYAIQDYASLPADYAVPHGRTKPYGTVHALLCARAAVDGPFCVLNADDYYGADAYRTIYEALLKLPGQGEAVMVGYLLKNTASIYGSVTRGICAVENGLLQRVIETKNIQMYADGSLRDLTADVPLDPLCVVSMNFWGFTPWIFPQMESYFADFLQSPAGAEQKSECLLPVMVDELLARRQLQVQVLHSDDYWFGMTYREDRPIVSAELEKLHRQGVYPDDLAKA